MLRFDDVEVRQGLFSLSADFAVALIDDPVLHLMMPKGASAGALFDILMRDDLFATDHVFPERIGEIYHLAYSPEQRWFYAPRMTRDEVERAAAKVKDQHGGAFIQPGVVVVRGGNWLR